MYCKITNIFNSVVLTVYLRRTYAKCRSSTDSCYECNIEEAVILIVMIEFR